MSKWVRASHILVKTEEEAIEIKKEIISGEIDFPHAAGKYSYCPSGGDGGDLGRFKEGVMVKEFDDAAFALDVNEISEPVKTQFGWHLILVTEKGE